MATNYSSVGRAARADQIQGMRAAKAAFQALPEVMRDALNEATFLTVSEIVRQAKANVLASPSVRTRSLYNAIGFVSNPKAGWGKAGIANVTTVMQVGSRKVKVRGVVIAGRGGSASTATGAQRIMPRRYAHLIEFGTIHFPAEPFMMPAVLIEKPLYLDRCLKAGKRAEITLARIGGRNQ